MERFSLKLEGVAHGGQALGRHEGKVIFVPYGLPGEEVMVEVVEERSRYDRARILEVVKPSPERITPRCPHFGTCGGCQWQHAIYEAQLRFKESILRGQLQRIGGVSEPLIRPSLGATEPWFYRNQIRFHIDEEGRLCFLAFGSRERVPIEVCYIMHPLARDVFAGLELDFPLRFLSIRVGTRTGEKMIILEMDEDVIPALDVDEPISCVEFLSDRTLLTLVGDNFIREEVGGRGFRISAGSFFQVNTEQLEKLIDVVRGYLAPQGDELLLDGYCGVGTFGLSFASQVGRVIGVEESGSAVADARFNAHQIDNVGLVEGRAEEVLPHLGRVDLAILDPPRQGCSREGLAALAKLTPSRIVYVSCDPATLARDVKRLSEAGYRLVETQPVDMFPQTYHIESVSLLER